MPAASLGHYASLSFIVRGRGQRSEVGSQRSEDNFILPYVPLNLGSRLSRKRRYSEDQFAQLQAEHQFDDTEYQIQRL